MVFRVIHVKDSLLPKGKVWSLDSLGICIYIYVYIQYKHMQKHVLRIASFFSHRCLIEMHFSQIDFRHTGRNNRCIPQQRVDLRFKWFCFLLHFRNKTPWVFHTFLPGLRVSNQRRWCTCKSQGPAPEGFLRSHQGRPWKSAWPMAEAFGMMISRWW